MGIASGLRRVRGVQLMQTALFVLTTKRTQALLGNSLKELAIATCLAGVLAVTTAWNSDCIVTKQEAHYEILRCLALGSSNRLDSSLVSV